jgi:hypothetical protein
MMALWPEGDNGSIGIVSWAKTLQVALQKESSPPQCFKHHPLLGFQLIQVYPEVSGDDTFF